jgi:hypothetical protein
MLKRVASSPAVKKLSEFLLIIITSPLKYLNNIQ